MERLGDLHKRATQKSYKIDLQKRPTKRQCLCQVSPACMERLGDLHKRATKERLKRDSHKEIYKRDVQKRHSQRYLQERPTKETYKREYLCQMRPACMERLGNLHTRPTKESLKRDLHKEIYERDLQKRRIVSNETSVYRSVCRKTQRPRQERYKRG